MMNDQNQPGLKNTGKPLYQELPRRISFLLRMWCGEDGERNNWRATLEMPETGKRIGFASLEQLFIYLVDYSESRDDDHEKENKEDVEF